MGNFMSDRRNRVTWSDEKKEWLKTWQPKLRRDANKLTEQVSRFKTSLPQFAEDAERASQPFLESCRLLLQLSWKNKFNPLSSEEAEAEFSKMHEKFLVWVDFMKRPEVSEAISHVNREGRTARRIQHRSLQQAEQAVLAQVEGDEFTCALQKKVASVIEQFHEMAGMVRGLKDYAREEEVPILQRLMLIHFIRFTYDFVPSIKDGIARFLADNASATVEELLGFAIHSVIVEATMRRLRDPQSFMPGVNDPDSLIVGYVGQVFDGTLRAIDGWSERGIAASDIDKSYFTVLGVDFSLSAKPR